jgi:hypothetical protein
VQFKKMRYLVPQGIIWESLHPLNSIPIPIHGEGNAMIQVVRLSCISTEPLLEKIIFIELFF